MKIGNLQAFRMICMQVSGCCHSRLIYSVSCASPAKPLLFGCATTGNEVWLLCHTFWNCESCPILQVDFSAPKIDKVSV